jgi:hypothetical protein
MSIWKRFANKSLIFWFLTSSGAAQQALEHYTIAVDSGVKAALLQRSALLKKLGRIEDSERDVASLDRLLRPQRSSTAAKD